MMVAPPGVLRNNPFDLMYNPGIPWRGQKLLRLPGGLCDFKTSIWGLRAGMIDSRSKVARGLNTIEAFVAAFAPPSQNATQAYIDHGYEWLKWTPGALIQLDTVDQLVVWARDFIVRQEVGFRPDGTNWYIDSVYQHAALMALGKA